MKEAFDVEWEYEDDAGAIVFVSADGVILRGNPGSFYDKNGDPGDAPEGDEVEFSSITCVDENGKAVKFDYSNKENLIDYVLETC